MVIYHDISFRQLFLINIRANCSIKIVLQRIIGLADYDNIPIVDEHYIKYNIYYIIYI